MEARELRNPEPNTPSRYGMKGRRVLVVTNMYPDAEHPHFGTFVQEQVEGLRARGLDVDVLIVGGKRQKMSYVQGLPRFWRRLRAHPYDLIHAHYVFSGIIARMQLRYPLVVSFHGAAEMDGWVGLLCRALAPLAEAVTVTSEQHKALLGRRDAFVVPCGADLDLFVPMPKEQARRTLGLPSDRRLVLFAAIVRREKRLDVVQGAVELLRHADQQVELVLATNVPHQRMPLFMNACDVLALASDSEGSPVVVKEAMACNLPIVSVDVGDVAQVIAGTEGCYLCERNPESMAEKLLLALNREKRTQGRLAIQALSLNRTVEDILSIYSGLDTRTAKEHT
jgi:teichuronic acid biosynthesis glycosyltransferase TuaC